MPIQRHALIRVISRHHGRCLAILLLCAAPALHAQTAPDSVPNPVVFPISCTPEAAAEFTRAVTLLHHMTYPEARESFGRVAALDPHCAMAHWGIAMTLFQPLWPTRPGPDALKRGWHEAQAGDSLAPPTARERLYLAAADSFFLDPASADYWGRIRRWERASATLRAAVPDDDEVAAFYALALLAIPPTDTSARARADRAAALLLDIYRRHPGHPGAMHYLIHANDMPGRERESPDIMVRYAEVAPHNPHALHMPTHIATRLGDWPAVIRGNLAAADAALEFPAGDKQQFVWDEFPHAIEYLVYALLQQGADDSAAMEIARLRGTAHLEPTFKTAFHLASSQVRYALERRDWHAAEAITPRDPTDLDWDRFAWPEAIARFGRGLGAAHLGHLKAAGEERDRLTQLEAASRASGEELFARNIGVLRLELDGWIADRRGLTDSAAALLQAAARLEESTPKHAVTPAPTLPAAELQGDLFLAHHHGPAALVAYRHSLELYPGRFNSLLGAARAARASGGSAAAADFYRQLMAVAGGSARPALSEAKAYIKTKR